MNRNSKLTKEKFDNLLEWFSADRDEAGIKYEENREGLIRFFRIRDCADPIALADETLNRVADKLPEAAADREKIPVKYIYGFAVNVYHEYERVSAKNEIQLDLHLPLAALVSRDSPDNKSKVVSCLEQCLAKFSPDESDLIIDYYGQDKSIKFEFRRRMAESKNITIRALHTRVYRIKTSLRKCVEKCTDEKNL